MPKVVDETFKPPLISNGNERFFFIDSHSRNSEGLVDPHVSAVLMEFIDLDSLVNYLMKLSLNSLFTITPVREFEMIVCSRRKESVLMRSQIMIILLVDLTCLNVHVIIMAHVIQAFLQSIKTPVGLHAH